MLDSILKRLFPALYKDRTIEVIKTVEVPIVKEVVKEVIKEVPVEKVSPIDEFLSKRYKTIKNIAYENKRQVGSNFTKQSGKNIKFSYSVYLNQLITPDSFEVQKFRKQFAGITDLYSRVQKEGDALAKLTRWVDEQTLYDSGDDYLYAEESLTGMSQFTDCEDVCNVMSSLEPEVMASNYGFYYPEGKSKNPSNRFGHAFPSFVYQDKLYYVETTGNSVEIVPESDDRYESIIMVTKNNTYKLKDGVTFGKLLDL